MLTHENLKKMFFYDPETGFFSRITPAGRPTNRPHIGTPDKDGYLRTSIKGKRYSLHRLAFFYMTGTEAKNKIDHINGQKDDNKWSNLREATSLQNAQNRLRQIKNKSLPLGVFAEPGGYRARIRINGRRVHLGTFKTPDEAAKAYAIAKQKHHF